MAHLIFFFLFLLPFIVLPFGISPFETPKVYIAELVIIVLSIWHTATFPLTVLFRRAYIPLLLLGIIGVLQLVFIPTEVLLFGNVFRMQGIFLSLLLLAFAVISSQADRKMPSIRVLLLLIGLQLLAVIFIQGSVDVRGIGTMGEPNALVALLIFLWPWLLFGDKKIERLKIYMIVGIFMTVLMILFSGSRSGFIAFGLQGIFLLLIHFRASMYIGFLICAVLYFVSLALPFFNQTQVFENRADVWRVAFAAGFEKPLLGWGIGNTEYALQTTAREMGNVLQYQRVDSAHNVFLDWWVQGGVLGLGIFIFIVSSAFRIFLRQKKIIYLVILLGLITVMSFNPMSVVTLVHFWWVIGQSLKNEEKI